MFSFESISSSTSSDINSLETILFEAIKLEYQTFSPVNQSNSKELNDAERAKLNELIVANKVLSVPFDEDIENSLLGQMRVRKLDAEVEEVTLHKLVYSL